MGRSHNAEDWIAATRRRLAVHGTKMPDTKAGQIRALWPEIQAARDNGQSLKSIWRWLEEEAGISVSITSFTSYISRIRRREAGTAQLRATTEPKPGRAPASNSRNLIPPEPSRNDPLAQAMQALSKPKLDIREMHGDGDPRGKNLI